MLDYFSIYFLHISDELYVGHSMLKSLETKLKHITSTTNVGNKEVNLSEVLNPENFG